jgi:hypothetical protein
MILFQMMGIGMLIVRVVNQNGLGIAASLEMQLAPCK